MDKNCSIINRIDWVLFCCERYQKLSIFFTSVYLLEGIDALCFLYFQFPISNCYLFTVFMNLSFCFTMEILSFHVFCDFCIYIISIIWASRKNIWSPICYNKIYYIFEWNYHIMNTITTTCMHESIQQKKYTFIPEKKLLTICRLYSKCHDLINYSDAVEQNAKKNLICKIIK